MRASWLLAVTVALLSPLAGVGQVVNFPDPGLEEAVRLKLDMASGDITQADMAGMSDQLRATNKGITDLSGIEFATNISSLDLNGNSISDLSPLSGLTALTILNLSRNEITDLSPISGLTALEVLYISNNYNNSDLSALRGLTNLVDLRIFWNDITDISPLSGLTKLKILFVSSANVSDLSPLQNLATLEELNLNYNEIIDLSPLSGLSNLKDLSLSNNQISDVSPLSALTNLEGLSLYENQISNISPLSGLTNLTWLSLYDNQISDISALSGLSLLDSLFLNDNQIADISPLSGMTELSTLRLHENQIVDISSLAALPALRDLRLDANLIESLEALAGLTNLLTVDVGNNALDTREGSLNRVIIDDLINDGADVTFEPQNFTPTLTIDPLSSDFQSAGGAGSISVTASAAWTASADDDWITLTGDTEGTGDATVSFDVAANSETTSRSGTIVVGTMLHTVNQEAAEAMEILPPDNVQASDEAFTDRIQVTWDAVEGIHSYTVHRAQMDDSTQATALAQVNGGTTYDDLDVTAEVTYYYFVTSEKDGETSDFSSSDAGSIAVENDDDGNGGNGNGDGTDLWGELEWLDGLYGADAPNIWSNGLGWLVSQSNSSDDVMFWMEGDLDYFWSQEGVYPWLWSFGLSGWFWYYEGTGDGTGAWFYNLNAGANEWITNP